MINLGQVRRFARHVNADHARKFTEHMMPHVVRPAQVIWNQVIGFFFIVLALIPVPSAIRNFGKDGATSHLVLTIPFVLLMGYFGVSSFWRARKISKS